MTPDLRIQQAVALADSRGSVRVSATSDGLDTAEVERIAVLFGSRPPGVACPAGALRLSVRHAARRGRVRRRSRPGDLLGFRFLILDRTLYRHLGDPFAIADRYPPQWTAGNLPELAWPAEKLPERTLDMLDELLKHGDGPLLLGATQALVDGYRIVLPGTTPNESLARDLWQLLPDSTRRDLWPASFAFSNELGFHFAIVPTAASWHCADPGTSAVDRRRLAGLSGRSL